MIMKKQIGIAKQKGGKGIVLRSDINQSLPENHSLKNRAREGSEEHRECLSSPLNLPRG